MSGSVVSSPAANGHAPLSPSAAHRWSKCPASIPMSRGYPDTSTDAAKEGTAIHALGEAALRWRYEDNMSPESWYARISSWDRVYGTVYNRATLAEVAQVFEQEIIAIAGPRPGLMPVLPEVFGETDIDQCWGTSDAVILDYEASTLWVCDLKAGRVPVSAVKNPQLALYGDAMLRQFDPTGAVFMRVNLCIIQPRCGGLEVWHTTPRDILLMTGYLKARAELVDSPEPVFQPSEGTCRFCRFKTDCSARAKWRVQEMFGTTNPQDITATIPGRLSDEALAKYTSEADMIKRWVKDVEAAAAERFPEDTDIPPGFHIEERRRLKITDTEEAIRRLSNAGIQPTERRLKSITQLKKEVGTKEGLQFLLGSAVSETTVRRLVPDE